MSNPPDTRQLPLATPGAAPLLDASLTAGHSIAEVFEAVLRNTDVKESTRQTYHRAFGTFADWFTSNGEKHDAATLVRFKRYLESRKEISAATKSLYLNTARLLYRRLFELGVSTRDFSLGVRGFRPSGKHKRSPISDAAIERLYEHLNTRGSLKMRALFDLLFRQGLRRNEVVSIEVRDIHFDDGTLAIAGKGRDEKELVFLHSETKKSLREYVTHEGIRDGYIFPSPKKRGTHITTTRLYQIVMEVHASVEITSSPHAYRKAFTSRLIDANMNLLTVQQFTRHRSLDMLKVYYDRKDMHQKLPAYEKALAERPDSMHIRG